MMLDSESKKRLIEQSRVVRARERGKFKSGDYDIVSRREPEDVVKQSERLYRAIFDGSPDAIFITAPDASFVEVNEAASVLTGYSPEELKNMTIPDLHEEEDIGAYRQFFHRIMAGEQITREARILRKDGTKVDTEFSNRKIMVGDAAYMHTIARDITERRLAEETLRRSEATWRSLTEDSPDIIMTVDINGTIQFINRIVENVSGDSDMLGSSVYEYVPPEHVDIVRNALGRVFDTGIPESYQTYVRNLEGAIVGWCETHVGPVFDDDAIVAATLAARDITERRRAEDALRESESKFRSITENAVDFIFIKDMARRYTFVNQAMQELLGLCEEEILGKTPEEIFGSAEGHIIKEVDDRTFSGETVNETRSLVMGGKELFFNTSQTPLTMEDGEVTSIMGIVRDVTERRKADEALRESEQRLKILFESAPDAYYIHDLEGRFVDGNRAAEELVGYQREEVIGKNFFELGMLTEADAPKISAAIADNRDGKPAGPLELTVNRKDGGKVMVETRSYPVDIAGETLILGIARDITERKKTEEALRESERRFRNLSEAAFEGIAFSENGVLVDANKAFARIYRCGLGELVGRPVTKLVAPEHRELVAENIRSGYEGVYEHKGIRKDGSLIDLETQGRAVTYQGRKMRMTALRDITGRKKAEDALQESEEKLRLMSAHMYDYIMMLDLEFNIQFINKAGQGLTVDQLIGKPPYIHVDKDEQSRIQNKLKKVVETGEPSFYETEYHRPDGSIIYFESIASPVFVEDKITGIVVSSREITERKQAEEALRNEKEFTETALNAQQDTFFLFEPATGKAIRWNRAFNDITGYADEEISAMPAPGSYYSPEDLKRASEFIEEVLETGIGAIELELICKDGRKVPTEYNVAVIRDEDSNPKYIISIGRDITEHKRAEETLRENEEAVREQRDRAQKYLDVAAVMFVALDGQGNVTLINKRGCELLGWDELEIVGKNWLDNFLPKSVREQVKAVFLDLIAGKIEPAEYFENPILCNDGSQKIIAWHNTVLKDGSGNINGVLSSGEDITDRKQARQELLDDREQLKSLASQLSLTEERERHRLATVLHDQVGQSLVFSKLKLDQVRKCASSEELARTLDEVCDCIGKIIENTRTLTFDLSSPILYELGFEAAVAEWLNDEIEQKHGIETEFENDQRPKQLGDDIRTVLFRNVRELLLNVVKHAHAGKVKVSLCRVDGNIHVSVEDDGVGFDPVEVTSMAAKRAEFGLFSIRERLEQLGGHIEINSKPGSGSRITMTAPLRHTQADNAPQTA